MVADRLCLDQVRSARARYERPGDIGPEVAALNQSRRLDPADRITLDDEVRIALLEVLRRLSPGERVSFVLHDVFGVPFDVIAETVGRPIETCRQLTRRAREKFALAQPKPGDVPVAEHQLVTEKFITACANGDLEALAAVLDPRPRTRRRECDDAGGGAPCDTCARKPSTPQPSVCGNC